jgi:hypothetical protein
MGKMKKSLFTVIWITILCCLLSESVFAADKEDDITLGIRGSIGASRFNQNFQLVEAFGTYPLPWKWTLVSDVVLGMFLEASLGVIHGGGDSGAIAMFGSGLDLELLDGKLEFNLGANLTGMTRREYGDVDLGSHFAIASHTGVNFQIHRHLILGYRFQHISNAGLSSRNTGLNLHMVEVSYRF